MAADFEVVGPDAAAVAAAIDLAAVKGRFAFDLPADGQFITERVAQTCEQTGLRARVAPIERMPHRQRLLRLLDEHSDGVEVPFYGIWAWQYGVSHATGSCRSAGSEWIPPVLTQSVGTRSGRVQRPAGPRVARDPRRPRRRSAADVRRSAGPQLVAK